MEPPAPAQLPQGVRDVLERLWSSGHAAYVVAAACATSLLGRPVTDWDVATDALPERTLGIFPRSGYTNRFGTVTVPAAGQPEGVAGNDLPARPPATPITAGPTRSPSPIRSRRTWRGATSPSTPSRGGGHAAASQPVRTTGWTQPTACATCAHASCAPWAIRASDSTRTLCACCGPHALLRSSGSTSSLATRGRWRPRPRPSAGSRASASAASCVGCSRRRSAVHGVRDPGRHGRACHAIPELDAQRGVPQDKVTGHDLWGHSLATLDAAAAVDPDNELLRLAALLHDVGKPADVRRRALHRARPGGRQAGRADARRASRSRATRWSTSRL